MGDRCKSSGGGLWFEAGAALKEIILHGLWSSRPPVVYPPLPLSSGSGHDASVSSLIQ